jgi:bacterioferritin
MSRGRGEEKHTWAQRIVELLNQAYRDEWLAHYQYWVGAKLVAGPMRGAIEDELLHHGAEELAHAELLTSRVVQMGGAPTTEVPLSYKIRSFELDCPGESFVLRVVDQAIEGERRSLALYRDVLRETRLVDPVTYDLALRILEDEIAHEEDLLALRDDVWRVVGRPSVGPSPTRPPARSALDASLGPPRRNDED